MNRRRALLGALLAAALDAGVVAVLWRVHEARGAVGALLKAEAPFYRYEAWAHFQAEARVLQIGGGTLLLLALGAVLAGIGWARRRSAGPLAILASVVPATIAGLVGAGLLGGACAFLAYHEGCGDPEVMAGLRYEAFASHAVPFQAARLAVVVVALLSTAAVLVLARAPAAPRADDETLPSRPRYLAPGALFLVGLAAFAATRAEASDSRRPMPRPATPGLWLVGAQATEIPPALGCAPGADDGPVLALAQGAWLVDGVATADAADLAHVLVLKRELWRQIQPGKPFLGVLLAAIPADTPLDTVRPVLAAVRAAGFPDIRVLEARPMAPWPTRTLGHVPYLPRGCQVPLAGGLDEATARTWGELAIALARRP